MANSYEPDSIHTSDADSQTDECEPEYEVIYNEDRVFCHVRQLLEYARLKGVDPTELTPEEVAMFEYKE